MTRPTSFTRVRVHQLCRLSLGVTFFFFFQAEDGIRDVAVTGVQTCALPISWPHRQCAACRQPGVVLAPRGAIFRFRSACIVRSVVARRLTKRLQRTVTARSEEHTSELQSRLHLVCRLLLEKKKYRQLDDELC